MVMRRSETNLLGFPSFSPAPVSLPISTYSTSRIRFLHYPEYESDLGIDHSRIVDLLQVVETVSTIDVWTIWEQQPSLKCVECQDPISGRIRTFNMESHGIWVTKALNGDRELFLAFGSAFLGREKPLLGQETPRNLREIPPTQSGYTHYHDYFLLHSPV